MNDRTMYIIRGLPGSGKSTLARALAEVRDAIICSADDYFIKDGVYSFDREKLGEAHAWCKGLAEGVMRSRGQLAIDNTNIRVQEMAPYLALADKFGYFVRVMIPSTPWAWNPEVCFAKSTHDVPYGVIKRMHSSFEPFPQMRMEGV